MKSYFEIVLYSRGRILAEAIFMFSNCRLLLVSLDLVLVLSCFRGIFFHVRENLIQKVFQISSFMKMPPNVCVRLSPFDHVMVF